MKLHHLLLFAVPIWAALAVNAQARLVRTITDTFEVTPDGELLVATFGGNIDVMTGPDHQVAVTARLVFRQADTEAEADKVMESLELVIEQTDRGVSASARRRKAGSGWFGPKANQVAVHIQATVPERYHLQARTAGGNVTVADLVGSIQARTSGGDIAIGHIEGPVDVKTSGGNIEIEYAQGAVRAHTSGGDVRIDHGVGDVTAGTSGGNVRIGRVGGNLQATTSGGNVFARLAGALTKEAVMRTSGGNVTAWVDRDIGFRLDARTSGGRVQADGVTISIEEGGRGKSQLSGEVNGGGPTLKMRSSGGDIRLKTY